MDTEKARIYLAVLEYGSLSAAGDALGYTTSGVSRSIASLEEETGLRLLDRSRKGAAATADAEPLIPVMQEMVRQAELYTQRAEEVRGLEAGEITIGTSYGGYFRVIAEPLKNFIARYPQIRVRTLQGTSAEVLRAVERHEADFAIMTWRKSDLNFRELLNDPMTACLPDGHPLTKHASFPLEEFGREPYIAPFPDKETDYRRALAEAGVKPNIQYTTTDVYTAYCMTEAGLGLTLLNHIEASSWSGRVTLMPTDPPVYCRIGIMYPEETLMSKAAARLLQDVSLGTGTKATR